MFVCLHSFLHFVLMVRRRNDNRFIAALKFLDRNQDNIKYAADWVRNVSASGKVERRGSSSTISGSNTTPKRKSNPNAMDTSADSPGQVYEKKGSSRKRRSYLAATSKSKGFFRKGSRKGSYLDNVGNGVTVCREYGSAAALPLLTECAYIGHVTCTVDHTLLLVANAIVKFWAVKNDLPYTELSQIVVPSGISNQQIDLFGKQEPAAAANVTVSNVSIIAGTTTFLQVVTKMKDDIKTFYSVNPYGVLTVLKTQLAAAGQMYKQYDLRRAKLVLRMKSSLKIQNRTKSVSGGVEDDDVDNVPIYGKHYSGNGNYIGYTGYDGSGRMINYIMPNKDQSNGHLQFNITTGVLAEPPRKKQLINVDKLGKAHLDPGEIKTSVIYHTIRIGLNKLFLKLKMHATQLPVVPLGNYRVFAFEKMIKTGSDDTSSKVMSIAYELDEKSSCVFSAPKIFTDNTNLILENA